MPRSQTFTIFRLQDGQGKSAAAGSAHCSRYPGFGASPTSALNTVLTEIAEIESHSLAGLPRSDPDWDLELMNAMDTLEGRFEVYSGIHKARPASQRPLLTG